MNKPELFTFSIIKKMKIKKTVFVKTKYEIEIDLENDLALEYKAESELIEDCAGYGFSSVLPVIRSGGVKVLDKEVVSIS